MRSLFLSFFAGFLAYTPTFSALLPRQNGTNITSSTALPERLLHHWPNGTWVENIAVRPNGNLLLTTSTPNGTVWHVKEPWTDEPEVELLYNFDEWVDRLIGIGESTPDKYVVVGSRFYSPGPISSQVARTFCAMELSFEDDSDTPTARLIAWFPEATLLQSVTALPWDRSTVLISDQYLLNPRYDLVDLTPSPGQVWRLDTKTGEHEIVMTNYTEMNTTYANSLDVGINGIKIHGDKLYWVNTDTGGVYSMQIDKKGYPVPPADPDTLVITGTLFDDLAFGPGDSDTIWASALNAVFAISTQNGSVAIVDGVGTSDNLTFPGPTATGFGRTENDSNILYVTGNLYSIPENILDASIGGWLRAIDTTGFHF